MDASVVDVLAAGRYVDQDARCRRAPEVLQHCLDDVVHPRLRKGVSQGVAPGKVVGENVDSPSPQLIVSKNGPMPVMASALRLIDVFTPATVLCEAVGAVTTGDIREVTTATDCSYSTFRSMTVNVTVSVRVAGERERGADAVGDLLAGAVTACQSRLAMCCQLGRRKSR